jgi:DNA polymerase III subunit epsilon
MNPRVAAERPLSVRSLIVNVNRAERPVPTMATNRYAGTCKTCGKSVPAESGELRKDAGAWVVFHSTCIPAAGPGWHSGLLGSYDCETTGTDPFNARLISAAFVTSAGARHEFLVDPGVDIPEGATAVHGITDEQVRANGLKPAGALEEIAALLAGHLESGAPLIVFNAPFDLTLLEAELERHGLTALRDRIPFVGPIVDPLVMDRKLDRYRKGSRTLEAQCAHYGVTIENAHDACADAVAALEVARALAARYPEVAEAPLAELHAQQAEWKESTDRDFAAYRAKRGEAFTPQPGWPVLLDPAAAL